jgi:ribosome-binding protein aMBF1 (putative translation factor)
MKKNAKKRKSPNFVLARPYIEKKLRDPEIRFYYEQEKAKEQMAAAIHSARMRAHLSQAELAEKIGTTQSAIARLEGSSGRGIPSLPILSKIAKACGGIFKIEIEFRRAARV